jgi:hypothetical protein
MKSKRLFLLLAATALTSLNASNARAFSFDGGDLVISTVSDSDPGAANSGLDTAAPIVLDQFQLGSGGTSITADGSLILPQTGSGDNSAISGEYGSASEGILEDSVNGAYLTIMGYGVNVSTFNSAPTSTYGTAALGQTTSLTAANQTGTPVTTVARVVALIGANGSVDTSTALTGVFNTNNPRSVATVDGSSFYVSGQGVTGDGTGGVFYATDGATTATAIDANTSTTATGANPAQGTETRSVQIVNTGSGDTLWVSRDAKVSGTPNDASDIRSFTNSTGGLPTSTSGLVAARVLPSNSSVNGGNTGSIDLPGTKTSPPNLLDNGVNNNTVHAAKGTDRNGKFVYLSPEQFFLASPDVMYVTDSGQPKNGSADAAAEGEGGLQKWIYSDGAWNLQYDLSAGLGLVNNDAANSATPTAPGVTGLFGLTGEVVGTGANATVELFATSYGLNELSTSYLYEITDSLDALAPANGESFNTLETAAAGTLIRGVAFAPEAIPEPSTWALMLGGAGLLAAFARFRNRLV